MKTAFEALALPDWSRGSNPNYGNPSSAELDRRIKASGDIVSAPSVVSRWNRRNKPDETKFWMTHDGVLTEVWDHNKVTPDMGVYKPVLDAGNVRLTFFEYYDASTDKMKVEAVVHHTKPMTTPQNNTMKILMDGIRPDKVTKNGPS
jgi:hypothetical protein